MDRLFFIKQRRYQKNKKPASEKTVIIFISIINKTTKKAENQKKHWKTTFSTKLTIKKVQKVCAKKLGIIVYSNIKEEQRILF